MIIHIDSHPVLINKFVIKCGRKDNMNHKKPPSTIAKFVKKSELNIPMLRATFYVQS